MSIRHEFHRRGGIGVSPLCSLEPQGSKVLSDSDSRAPGRHSGSNEGPPSARTELGLGWSTLARLGSLGLRPAHSAA
ncbi:hypothetical protein PGTUg99_007622 [Puccinia graminis f. sp. tritici]|uniref:Uncharacterized protein n=1 Tax=Puccinia graminis f. sp. tritici TaxID=56615 RepID=A0A5B0N7F5_PUCGR|nr:hypothetical protein PGTUg99_007622 [Puccinia graminis f. sp. tritici]